MPILRKLNPDATDKNFNFTRNSSNCCPEDQVCAYKFEFPVANSLEAVTFVNSKGKVVTNTLSSPVNTIDDIENALKGVYKSIEEDNGFGAIADKGGLTVKVVATNTQVVIITDVVINSFTANGSEVTPTIDCTTAKVCDCQFTVAVGSDVSGIELGYNGSTATLATGTYPTGDSSTLKSDVETALTSLTAEYVSVDVRENTDEGLFTVTIDLVGDCSAVTWNNNGLQNCGCSQEYLFE